MTTDQRIHTCGQPMNPAVFAHNDPTPQNRSQPIWTCRPCNAWEPREGWKGTLPDGWDGEKWDRPVSALDQETDTCYVEMWTVVGNTVTGPSQILGRTTWTELDELVTKQGGERLTYDLYEVPNDDGTTTRYRATEKEVAW